MKLGFKSLIGGLTLSVLIAGIATAQDAPSIFFDQSLPIRASVDIHDALKTGEFSNVYIRPRSFRDDPVRPIYKIEYINDFEACNQFDDNRTLYKDLLGYKLSAAVFDKDGTVDRFMEEPRSAAFLNGECLLAKPIGIDAPESDIDISYKSKKQRYFVVSNGSKTSDPVETLDLSLKNIRLILAGTYDPEKEDNWRSAPRSKEKKTGLVSDDNIVRALTHGSETHQHVALYLLRERISRYLGDGVDISEKPQSKAIANTLLAHDFLSDDLEINRAAILQALAAVIDPDDSARAKAAIFQAMDTEYPFTMPKGDRDNGAQWGIKFPDEGTPRKGHQSQKITLGTAVLLLVLSETDRQAVIARYPEAYDKLITGTYKSLGGPRALGKLLGGK